MCDACHLDDYPLAPMLRDAAWAKIADVRDTLCSKCFFDRAIERQINLTFADLEPCAFNLFDRPNSWFDLFLNAEWREAEIVLGQIEKASAPGTPRSASV
jgi:hypothetical protein